jgi:cobalt/nickel transport system permease protein
VNQHLLNPYQHRSSLIHRLPAVWKWIGAVTFIFAIVLAPRSTWMVFAGAGSGLIFIALLSRIPPRFLLKRILYLEPFVLGVAGLSLLQTNGLSIFLSMLVKSTLCLFCMVLLAGSTPFSELLAVLRRLRIPALLITSLALTYRYLFLLQEEMVRMKRARQSRTFVLRRRQAWQSLATVIALLFIRTSERAERVYNAMCARGWRT